MGNSSQNTQLLTPREAEFFRLRYDRQGKKLKTLEEVAESMNISRQRAMIYQRQLREKMNLA